MPRQLLVVLAAVPVLLAGCGSEEPAPSLDPPPIPSAGAEASGPDADAGGGNGSGGRTEKRLRAAVKEYSDAFLSGNGAEAYDLLSQRCRERLPRTKVLSVVQQAGATYGNPLPFKSFEATVRGKRAQVSYTYVVSALDQSGQAWVREQGEWRSDVC